MTDPNDQNPITKRFANKKKTVIIDDEFKRQKLSKPDNIREPDFFSGDSKRVALFILGMVERIDFDATPVVTLGRFNHYDKLETEIDLTDFGAVNRGVSRTHCQLKYQDGKIIVTDLGSTNGTFVAGKRLEPHQPHTLERGEDLVVGRLPVQIVSGR